MEENNASVLTLVDLVNLFKKNFVKLLIIGIVVAILGGVFGGYRAMSDKSYNAELEIYVSPSENSDRLLYDLQSGRFAERLLLEKNGLPAKELCNVEDYNAALKTIEELADIRQQRIEKNEEIARYYTADIENKYNVLKTEYDNVLNVLKMYKSAQADALVNESHTEMIAFYEQKLQEAMDAKDEYYANYYSKVVENKIQLTTELSQLTDRFTDKRDEMDEAIEKVLVAWRQDPEVGQQVKLIMSCVSYEYHQLDDEQEKKAAENSQETSYGDYIKISISVPDSSVPDAEAFVEELVSRYQSCIADYVQYHLEESPEIVEAKCKIVSPIVDVKCVSESVIGEAVKYAVVGAVAGVGLVYVILVVRRMIVNAEKIEAAAKASEQNRDSSADTPSIDKE